MSVKILTQNSIENTNIDGARENHFSAGMRSGIVKGAFNEGKLFLSSSNVIALDSCELRISGHRIILDSVEYLTLSNTPTSNTKKSLFAEIVVNETSTPIFRLFIENSNYNLKKDNLFKTNSGSGTYQIEIGTFIHKTDGTIADVFRTIDVITGGVESGDENVSNLKFNGIATSLSSDSQPQVNIDYNEETKEYDFIVGIPKVDLETYENPNILINGDFRINQRGQTNYVGANTYFVDRWKFQENYIYYDVATKTFTSTRSSTGYICHHIEDLSMFYGQNVTLSIKVDGVVYSGTITLPTSTPTSSGQIGERITFPNGRIYIQYLNAQKAFTIIMGILSNKTITVDYVKLEKGSIATPNTPKHYAEELLLCMRYYQIRSNSYTIETSAIDRPIPMRVDGTIGTTTINDVTYNYVDAEIY